MLMMPFVVTLIPRFILFRNIGLTDSLWPLIIPSVALRDGSRIAFDRLLLATGAEPIRLPLPGMDMPHVHTLRTLADCRAIIAQAATARSAVVMGASFIGLEVAASLRARGIEVHVVAPEKRPMERVLGPQMGDFVRGLHEAHGVVFHLEDTATAIDARQVTLKSGGTIDADLVVAGRRRTAAAGAGRGGRPRDRPGRGGQRIPGNQRARNLRGRGHRAVAGPAQRSGDPCRALGGRAAPGSDRGAQHARRRGEKFDAVPFFWSQHYDVPINYVGHAEAWDDYDRRRHRGARLCRAVYAQSPITRRRVDLSRHR